MSSQSISFRPAALIRQIPWSVDRKAALGLLLILVALSLVGWLYLTQASYLTATTFRVEELRTELAGVQRVNAALELEIASFEALPRIEQRAKELGFGPSREVRYLAMAHYPDPGGQAPPNQITDGQGLPRPAWLKLLEQASEWLAGETS